jgi:hypothetical protein
MNKRRNIIDPGEPCTRNGNLRDLNGTVVTKRFRLWKNRPIGAIFWLVLTKADCSSPSWGDWRNIEDQLSLVKDYAFPFFTSRPEWIVYEEVSFLSPCERNRERDKDMIRLNNVWSTWFNNPCDPSSLALFTYMKVNLRKWSWGSSRILRRVSRWRLRNMPEQPQIFESSSPDPIPVPHFSPEIIFVNQCLACYLTLDPWARSPICVIHGHVINLSRATNGSYRWPPLSSKIGSLVGQNRRCAELWVTNGLQNIDGNRNKLVKQSISNVGWGWWNVIDPGIERSGIWLIVRLPKSDELPRIDFSGVVAGTNMRWHAIFFLGLIL